MRGRERRFSHVKKIVRPITSCERRLSTAVNQNDKCLSMYILNRKHHGKGFVQALTGWPASHGDFAVFFQVIGVAGCQYNCHPTWQPSPSLIWSQRSKIGAFTPTKRTGEWTLSLSQFPFFSRRASYLTKCFSPSPTQLTKVSHCVNQPQLCSDCRALRASAGFSIKCALKVPVS